MPSHGNHVFVDWRGIGVVPVLDAYSTYCSTAYWQHLRPVKPDLGCMLRNEYEAGVRAAEESLFLLMTCAAIQASRVQVLGSCSKHVSEFYLETPWAKPIRTCNQPKLAMGTLVLILDSLPIIGPSHQNIRRNCIMAS
ncbi:hypothetical protein J1614_011466 [Plenodomus biglobosus]|nr:hypothetical protein J1614_011466 [Plenodomus biglobosus]